MVSVFSPVHEMLPSDYARVTEVTYLGTVYGTLAALRRMRPRRQGTIVFVGRSSPTAEYPSSRHTAERSTRSMVSMIRCGRSCCMMTPGSGRRWSVCRPSIRRSSPG
jgi:NAD(P)-dependent dehydrogenase (short-subunit alcohol dehydrogenase family)